MATHPENDSVWSANDLNLLALALQLFGSITEEDLRNFGTFKRVAEPLLRHAVSDMALLADLASRAEAAWHPNGFAVYSLDGPLAARGCVMRLHVWDPKISHMETWHPRIHSHDRHLASVVLAGLKIDLQWQRANESMPADQDTARRVDRLVADDNPNFGLLGAEIVRPAGESVVLRSMPNERRCGVGEFYFQPAGDFHEIPHPTGDAFATLCLKSPNVDPRLQVLLGRDEVFDRRVARRPLDVEERRILLGSIFGSGVTSS